MKDGWQTGESSFDSGVLSNPISFLRSGYYYWPIADFYRGGEAGGYAWSLRSTHTTDSNGLYFSMAYIYSQNNGARGYGFAVHCVSLAPNSICPKGWQLPTYEGDKSFYTLIITSYSMKVGWHPSEPSFDSGVLSNPLFFLRSGLFYWYYAGLVDRGVYGYYWSLRSYSTTGSNGLDFGNAYLSPQYSDNRGFGYAVRCVQILHHSH